MTDPTVTALRRLVESTEGGRVAVASAIHANEQTLYQILSEIPLKSGKPRSVGRDLRERLDRAFPGWRDGIAGMPESAPLIPLLNNPDYPSIRRVSFKLSAGVTGQPTEYVDDDDLPPIVFRREWYAEHGFRPERLIAAKVSGASMEPTLFDGDLVVVNTDSAAPKDGKAFAVNYDGVLAIKRLVKDSGEWLIRSDNPDKIRHPDKRVYEGVSLIGEVVYRQSERI